MREIIVSAEAFVRYLRWRVAMDFAWNEPQTVDKALRRFGTNPIIVREDGSLRSPGDRGRPGDL